MLEIKKQTTIFAVDAEGKPMQNGDRFVFIAGGKALTGAFIGITKSGALSFEQDVADKSIVYNVMPKSIDAIQRI